MPRITITVPDELLADAKACAAKAGVSVSELVRHLLAGHVRNERAPLPGNFEILLRFSLGQVSERDAMAELHLDDEDALSVLTILAGLPLPRLSLEETAAMRKNFGEMLDRFGKIADPSSKEGG